MNEHRKCIDCDKNKPIGDFYTRKRKSGVSVYRRCKLCELSLQTAKRYNITQNHYDEIYKSQNGLCAICNKPEKSKWKGKTPNISVDHCHETGKVRGLLCSDCNNGLGRFKDDPSIIFSAFEYLEKHKNG